MGRRDRLIAIYAEDLRTKCGIEPDMALLTKVAIGCGPAIYGAGAATVEPGRPGALETVKNNFLIRRLDLPDTPDLMDAIDAAIETYGRDEPTMHRAVVYYLLTKQLGRESAFG